MPAFGIKKTNDLSPHTINFTPPDLPRNIDKPILVSI